ncbi:MAG: hypothetical protein HY807_05435 [Nitrospirae bacterium]|nr:hypothetical protein [Nitrospirota bacterium]
MIIRIYAIICSLIIFHQGIVFGYDDQTTHPDITNKAVIDASSLDTFMRTSLGFEKGVNSRFPSNSQDPTTSALELLMTGSTDEDSPACRASNHFHDPLKTWNQSGMSDEPSWLDAKCLFWLPKFSNITWATGYLSPPPVGQKQTFSSDPYYAPINWDKARNYFYMALTATAKEDREANFASTFKTVGHVLHLLEDMAVPAHVRNDFTSHVAFNKITSDDFVKWFGNHYEYYVQTHTNTVTSIPASDINNNYPSFTNPRLTDFWDTDQYTGDNPSSGLNIGLAEFTNANYLSDSTIPYTLRMPYHMYTYPKIDDPNKLQICSDYEPGSLDKRVYLSRIDRGPCPLITEARTVDHFAALGFWNDFSVNTIIDSFLHNDPTMLVTPISLDDNVHKTYANDLIPRAVGYSAGLLDYFFRGDIDLIETDQGNVIVNNTNEEIDGTFELYYDDNRDGSRHFLWSSYLFIEGDNRSTDFNLIPPPFADLSAQYTLVFRGRLGSEEGAVFGKVVDPFFDVSKVHFIVFRDHDRKIRDNQTHEYKYPGSISAPTPYVESGDDRSGYYNTQSILMITAATRTVPESWGFANNTQYYWNVQPVSGQAILVQEGTTPGNRRLYHKAIVNVGDHSFTVNRIERSTRGFLNHPTDSHYVYVNSTHTSSPLHSTYFNDGYDAIPDKCDSSIIFMQPFWSGGNANSVIWLFGDPYTSHFTPSYTDVYGVDRFGRNPEFTGDPSYSAFPGELWFGNESEPWFVHENGSDVGWRQLSTEEINADWVEMYSGHNLMYPPLPF